MPMWVKRGLREDISMTAWKCKTRFLQPSNRYLQERMHGISHLHIARNPIPSSTTSNCRWTVWTPHSVHKDSVFINKPLTFWQKYQWWIICGVVLILSLLIIALVIYRFQQKKITLLSAHDTLLRNMPISYTQIEVFLRQNGTE